MTDARHAHPRYRALIQLLRTAEDLWNASRVFFARWDLSPSQFNVLNVLYGAPEGMSQSDLSRLLIMHRSNATGLIDRLEKRAFVRREPHPSDRRAYRVVITPAGADLLNQIYPHYFAAAERVWSNLPDNAVANLLEQLQGLTAQATAVAETEAAAAQDGIQLSRSLPRPPPPPRPRTEPLSLASDQAHAIAEASDPLRTSDL